MTEYLIKFARFSDPLAAAWAATIAYLSLTPLERLPLITPFSDKLEHFVAYGLLGFLTLLARNSRASIVFWLLLILLYGGLIELLQPYVNRYMELMDLIANSGGAFSGALLALLLLPRTEIGGH